MNSPLRLSCAALIAALSVAIGAEEQAFYLTIDTPPAPEQSPQEALQGFTLAPGFSIELVAAEPLVEDPIAIRWDEEGRMYVVEMRGYMPDAYGNGEKDPVGVIARLTDVDGDGVYDNREVLLDKLVLPRAIALVNEGLLVGEPPNLWLCPSSTGRAADIDCTNKRRLGSYGDQPGSVEHAENGLLVGVDNWLYSAKSNRRLRLRGGELVEEPTLFRGQWGIAQDNDGRLFYNTNSNLLLGDYYDAQQIVAAGNTSAPGLGAQVSRNDQLFAVRVNPGVNRAYVPGVLRADGRLNRPTSASGMTLYRGDQFPAEYARDAFVAEPAANAVAQLRLRREGLAVQSEHILYPDAKWEQVEFMGSTDERFRAVDVEVGPDGALYLVDMYRGIIQDHYFLSDELRAQVLARQLDKPVGMGRIWRIQADAGTPLRAAPDLSVASGAELVELLGHPNGWQRDTAQRLLLTNSDRGLQRALVTAVRSGQPLQATHALWVLEGRGSLTRRITMAALARPEPSVRLAAVRAGASKLRRKDLLAVARSTTDSVLLQQLTMSLATHNADKRVLGYLVDALLENSEDAYRPAAIKAAAYQQELLFLQQLRKRGLWSSELEASQHFVQQLVVQGFRAIPANGASYLNFANTLKPAEHWLQVAVLDGLYDVTRDDGFQRVVLEQPHAIFSTTDETLWPAVTRARRAFTWPDDDLAADAKPLTPLQKNHRALGADFYASRCASCHGEDGKGIASLAPPLADSPWVTGPSERLARILLQGLRGPIEVAGTTWDGVMPGHGVQSDFSDEVASGLMTHLHRSWGHTGRAIDPEFVATIRNQTAARNTMWTVPELITIPINTHYQQYTGQFGSPAFPLRFIYNGTGLEVKSGIFNGPMTAIKEDQFIFEPRQLRMEFVLDDGGQVVGVRMRSGDGESLLPRLGD